MRRAGIFGAAVLGLALASGALAQQGLPKGPDRTLAKVEPPRAAGCITDVTAGDHRYACDGITYYTMVDPMCLRGACGLIVDIHGAGMSAQVMRANTELNLLGPPRGYIVVQPSAAAEGTGSWNFETSPPKVAAFMDQLIEAFHVDRRRVHVTGFSMGAGMTFWFLCNRPQMLASTAVVTGSSANQVRAPGGNGRCIDALNADWTPRVPILFMNGVKDTALTEAAAKERADGLVQRLSLKGGAQVAGDAHFQRRRWTGEGGMVFDFLTHDYAAEGRLAGHCMPGGKVVNATTCSQGDIEVHWGETALEWFMRHPKGG